MKPNFTNPNIRPPVKPGSGGKKIPAGGFTPGIKPGNLAEHIGTTGSPPSGPRDPRGPVRNPTAYTWSHPANQPFSPQWYAAHPQAWQFTHPHADAVVAATAVGVARWLAVPYAAVAADTATVTGSQTAVAPTSEETGPELFPADDLRTPPATAAADGESPWMTIGVFALKPDGQAQATRVIHLAVGRDGTLRGSHYDLITGAVEDILGSVDKNDLRVAWSIGEEGKVFFEAPLGELTQAEGRVTAFFPDGKTGTWRTFQITN